MRRIELIHDKDEIERFYRRDTCLHLYEIGDLDPFFWDNTTWFGLRDGGGRLEALVLLYSGLELPCLLALCTPTDASSLQTLLPEINAELPERFYAHLSPNVERMLQRELISQGRFFKMALVETDRVITDVARNVERLTSNDTEELLELYSRSYPDNWFKPHMLETGYYFGIRVGKQLVCVSGVHVYSKAYRVAALGNITTDLDYRGKGFARDATAVLCRELLKTVEHVGLNVSVENSPALACYRRLGFEVIAEYGEFMMNDRARKDERA